MNRRLTFTAAIATIAASVGLHPLIAAGGWFWEGAGAVVVVAAVASLTRLRPLPVLVCLAASLLGLLLYLNLVFSSHGSFGGVLPTLASLHGLVRLNAAGWAEAAKYAPPVPGLLGVTFLAVSGIGLAAVFTDLFAVRLRRAAMAGLPLLALFTATVASKAATPAINEIMIFCAGVGGYLVLLVTDGQERIQLWGRLVAAAHTARLRPPPASPGEVLPDTRGLAAAGRRIGMVAIVAALVVPLLVPGLHARDLFAGPGSGTQSGGVPASLPVPLAQLNFELHQGRPLPVLTYHTDNPDPPYLQVYALELAANATRWTLFEPQSVAIKPDGRLPQPPGLSSTHYRVTQTDVTFARSVTGAISVDSHTQTFLPLPYPTTNVRAGDGWVTDPGTLMVWSVNPIGGLKYTATSKALEPTPQDLEHYVPPATSIVNHDLAVPASDFSLIGLAQTITKGAVTPYDKAVKLQQWFKAPGRFTYTLDASGADTANALKDFLEHTRRGFCQQFAFGFAILARLLNIPARVAVGYTAGTSLGHGNYRVTTSDAHAWPELYFQGVGWLAWEPTPSGPAAGQGTARAPSYTVPAGGIASPGGPGAAGSARNGGQQPGKHNGSGIQPGQRFAPLTSTAAGAAARRHGLLYLWLAGLAALVLLGAAVPVGARLVTRMRRLLIIGDLVGPGRALRLASLTRGRTADAASGGAAAGRAAEAADGGPARGGRPGAAADGANGAAAEHQRARIRAAWLEVQDALLDYDLGCHAYESPRAVTARVTAQLRLQPASSDALRRIAYAQERACYATRVGSYPALRRDLTVARRALAASVSLRVRWRARLFPASTVSAIRHSARHALDIFGWIDVGTSWLWGRLSPARRAGAEGASR